MENSNARDSGRIALIALFVLLVFSAVFYLQRMLFSDASFILYTIINSKKFSIQEHRYGSFITQIFPLLSTWGKIPLRALIFLYSISFNLFFFISGLVLYRQKQFHFVLLLAFYFTACITESFYWSNNEVHQGISWMFLTFGFVFLAAKMPGNKWWPLIVFSLLAFLALFSHPIVIIVTMAVFVFFYLDKTIFYHDRSTLFYVIITVLLVLLKTYFSATGSYDKTKMGTLAHSVKNLTHILDTQTAREFFKSCIQDYWQFLILFFWSIVYMIVKKKYLVLGWSLFCVLGYLICICIVYPTCDFKFYIESEWASISIMALLPFVWYVLPSLNKQAALLLLVVFFSMRLVQIGQSATKFEVRFNEMKRISLYLQDRDIPKAIILKNGEQDPMHRTLMMSWGLPFETLIYSNLSAGNKPVTAIMLSESEAKERLEKIGNKDYINPFWQQWYTELNPDYFRFDTIRNYTILDNDLNVVLQKDSLQH